MATNKYSNCDGTLVSSGGGSVRVTIASNVGRGNGGTSLSCREVSIVQTSGNTGTIRLNLSSACTSSTGIALPQGATVLPYTLLIDDVAKLYFSGTTNDTVDILYRY